MNRLLEVNNLIYQSEAVVIDNDQHVVGHSLNILFVYNASVGVLFPLGIIPNRL